MVEFLVAEMRLVPFSVADQHHVQVELRIGPRSPAGDAKGRAQPVLVGVVAAVIDAFGDRFDIDIDAGFLPLLLQDFGQRDAVAGLGHVQIQRQPVRIACSGQQLARLSHIARRRDCIGAVVVGVERTDWAIIADRSQPQGHGVEDRLAIGGQLERLDDTRVVARLAVGAQPHQIEAVSGDRRRDNARLTLQRQVERRRHTHVQVHLTAFQRIHRGRLIGEEDELQIVDARLAVDEIRIVGHQFHAILWAVVDHLERAAAVEVRGGIFRAGFDDQRMVVAEVILEEGIGRLQGEDHRRVGSRIAALRRGNVDDVAVQVSSRQTGLRVAQPVEGVDHIGGRDRRTVMESGVRLKLNSIRETVFAGDHRAGQPRLQAIVLVHIDQVIVDGVENGDLAVRRSEGGIELHRRFHGDPQGTRRSRLRWGRRAGGIGCRWLRSRTAGGWWCGTRVEYECERENDDKREVAARRLSQGVGIWHGLSPQRLRALTDRFLPRQCPSLCTKT